MQLESIGAALQSEQDVTTISDAHLISLVLFYEGGQAQQLVGSAKG